MPSDRRSIEALKNILSQIELLISTTDLLPENRTNRSLSLLRAAHALVDDLLNQPYMTPAAFLGSKGGSATAQKSLGLIGSAPALKCAGVVES